MTASLTERVRQEGVAAEAAGNPMVELFDSALEALGNFVIVLGRILNGITGRNQSS